MTCRAGIGYHVRTICHHLAAVIRLMSRLCPVKDSQVEVNLLYNTFKFELIESETYNKQPIPGIRVFISNLTSVYPDVKRVKKRDNGKWQTLYRGILIKTLKPINTRSDLTEILKYLPQSFQVTTVCEKFIVCSTDSGCMSNGNVILKQVTFHENGNWDLHISGTNVNLISLQVNSTYTFDVENVVSVCMLVDKLHICQGLVVNKSVVVTHFQILENFQNSSESSAVRTIRSVRCNRVAAFGGRSYTCQTCRTMTFSSPKDKLLNTIM